MSLVRYVRALPTHLERPLEPPSARVASAPRLCGALLLLVLFGCEARAPEPRFSKEPVGQPALPEQVAIKRDEPAQVVAPAPTPPPPAAPVAPAPVLTPTPTSPDPLQGKFDLAKATAGLPKGKTLSATLDTSYGSIACTLYADKTPKTVANFVGLARGLRPFWDAKSAAWVKRPLYDGSSFHRAVAGFMIQGGDHLGNGTGQVGYEIPDEIVGLKHDRAGLLCMANRGANTNGGQFFITDASAPHLTEMGTYTIFGECTNTDVIHKIAAAPRPNPGSERPEPVIAINKVTITRK
jgi:peptidyl-prolyl cis-trans isomerase A (cyclophilin A)